MEEEAKFCTGCGKNLEPGMQFCPQCGKVVSGSAADAEMKENMQEMAEVAIQMRRKWLTFLLFVYAIPVVIAGIIALADASAVTDAVWSSDEFQSWISSHGYDFSKDDVSTYITWASVFILLSGLCALGSGVLVYRKRKWIAAVILCLVASMLCFWSVFGLIIGFLVTWMLIDAKPLFDD